ncbi:hypothetical protein IG631_12969 [Alternaria alternata]|nr:hypothetical protein IG631_12969 [Alternaria alternata]
MLSRWLLLLFCFTPVILAFDELPTRAIGHLPGTSPTPAEVALNVKRALKQAFHVFRRDVCEDAFPGEDAVTNNCNPSNTLCCGRRGQSYPQCQNFLNQGWCCIANPGRENTCYVDQASVCNEADSVSCSALEEGVDEACCPRLTTCASGYNFTQKFVRCQIASSALVSLASAPTESSSLASSSASPTPTISSSPPNSETSPISLNSATASTAPPKDSSSSGLSSGAIAGIAIGPTLALVVGVGLWFLYKRRQKKKELSQRLTPALYQDAYPKPELASVPMDHGPYKYQHTASAPRQELPVEHTYELEGGAHDRS